MSNHPIVYVKTVPAPKKQMAAAGGLFALISPLAIYLPIAMGKKHAEDEHQQRIRERNEEIARINNEFEIKLKNKTE